jgi:hypothetical protein
VKRAAVCAAALLVTSSAAALTVTIMCDSKIDAPKAYVGEHGDLLESLTEAITKADHDGWSGVGGCYSVTVRPKLHGMYGCSTHGPCPPTK